MLVATISRALSGDAAALRELEAGSTEPQVAAMALETLRDTSAPPSAVDFAAFMLLHFARASQSSPEALSSFSEQTLTAGLSNLELPPQARQSALAACAA